MAGDSLGLASGEIHERAGESGLSGDGRRQRHRSGDRKTIARPGRSCRHRRPLGRQAGSPPRALPAIDSDPRGRRCRRWPGSTLVDAVVERGAGSISVNNAGLNIKNRTMRELTPEAWDLLIRTNLDGAFASTRPCRRCASKIGLDHQYQFGREKAGPLGRRLRGCKFGMSPAGHLSCGRKTPAFASAISTRASGYPFSSTARRRSHRTAQSMLQPEDVAQAVEFVASLPARASVPELVIKPTTQVYI